MSAPSKPPGLADIGQKLWGPRWAEPMAKALAVSEKEVVEWDANPDRLPAGIEERRAALAHHRVQEINGVVSWLKIAGLRRGGVNLKLSNHRNLEG